MPARGLNVLDPKAMYLVLSETKLPRMCVCCCVPLRQSMANGEWRHTISAKKKTKLGNLNHKCRASQTKDKNTHTSAQTPGVSINTLEGWHFHGWTPE